MVEAAVEAVAATEAVVAPVAAVVMEMAVARVVAETHDFNELKP